MIDLPGAGAYTLAEPTVWPVSETPATSRIVYAAAHVVADPLGDNTPGSPAAVDWDATLRFRRHLWSHGLRIADAMDTAQRNMGLDWAATKGSSGAAPPRPLVRRPGDAGGLRGRHRPRA